MCNAADKKQRVGGANPGAELAGKREIDLLLDQRFFELDPDKYDAFVRVLDNPSPAGPALKTLMKRRPSWQE